MQSSKEEQRDKKAFLGDQFKVIEEDTRMGKLETPGNISRKDGYSKRQQWYGPNRIRRY